MTVAPAAQPAPPGHDVWLHLQTPDWHVWLLAQACPDPQPPQLLLSACSLTQAPLQAV